MSVRMPGAFPAASRSEPTRATAIKESTTSILNQQQLDLFQRSHQNTQKTKNQHQLLKQLQVLVYILTGYQYIKYCHLACILPLILHVAVQSFLPSDLVYNESTMNAFRSTFMAATQEMSTQEHAAATSAFKRRVCFVIYWKTVFVIFYHTLFVGVWLVMLVNSGRLQKIEHGSWWFISFIGEETPHLDKSASFWLKVVKLGLPQLVATDMVILFVQLICFQCLFSQSSLMRYDWTLTDDEMYIIRPSSESGSYGTSDQFQAEVPCVLKVKLFETFRSDAFIETSWVGESVARARR